MKVVLALALCSLLGAVVFARAAPAEPEHLRFDPRPPAGDRGGTHPARSLEPAALERPVAQPPVPEALAIAEAEELLEDGMARLCGRVTPARGPQPPAQLVFARQCAQTVGDCEPRIEQTDADSETGEFSVELEPGIWRVIARADGYLPAVEDGLLLSPGEELPGLALSLEPGERITGTVYDADNEPLEAATVIASGQGYVRDAQTDLWGRFTIEGVPQGNYAVMAHFGGRGGDERTTVAGSSVHLVVGYHRKVRGRVLDARGFPVEGARIYSDYTVALPQPKDPFESTVSVELGGMHGCAPWPSCYQRTETDAAGRFELETTPGEVLVVGAQLGSQFALAFDVPPDAELELNLEESVPVRVVDSRGEPQASADVDFQPRPAFFRARTDAHGWARVPASSALVRTRAGTELQLGAPASFAVVSPQLIDPEQVPLVE